MNKFVTVAVVVCIFGILAFSVKGQDEDEGDDSTLTEESDDLARDARRTVRCSKRVSCTKHFGRNYYCSNDGYCRKYGKRGGRDVNDEIEDVTTDDGGDQTTGGEVEESVRDERRSGCSRNRHCNLGRFCRRGYCTSG